MDGTTSVASPSESCIVVLEVQNLSCADSAIVMNLQTRKFVEIVLYVGILPVLFLIGAPTNAVSMLVFFCQGLRDHVTASLFCLCAADLLYLLAVTLRFSEKVASLALGPWWYDLWLQKLVQFRLLAVHAGFSLASNFVSMFIAVDRCLCVVFPLHLQRMRITFRTAMAVLLAGIPLSVLGVQVLSFLYDASCAVQVSRAANNTYTLVVPSQLYKDNTAVMDAVDVFVFSTIIPTISLVIIAGTTAITAMHLRLAVRWRHLNKSNVSAASTKEASITRMLIVISGIYIVCVTPRVLLSLLRFVLPEFRVWGRLCNVVVATDAMMNILLALNSALNFFVYITLSSKFKDTLKKLLRC